MEFDLYTATPYEIAIHAEQCHPDNRAIALHAHLVKAAIQNKRPHDTLMRRTDLLVKALEREGW